MTKRSFLLLLALLGCLMLGACQKQMPVTPETTTAPTETIPAPTEPKLKFKTTNLILLEKREDALTIKQDGLEITLQSSTWSEDQAERFARDVFRFRDAIAAYMPLGSGRVLAANRMTPDLTTDQVRIDLSGTKSPTLEQYWRIYLLLTGDSQDYGTAYGLVAEICRDLQLCPVETTYSGTSLAFYLAREKNMRKLDLTLPMLEDTLFSPNDVAYARDIAVCFADFLLERYGWDALNPASGQDELRTAQKNEWLRSINCSKDYAPFAALPIAPNTNRERSEFPYTISTDSAVWYFALADLQDIGYDKFMASYLAIDSVMELDFADAREALRGYTADPVTPVSIHTRFFENKGNIAGTYYSLEGINLYGDWDQVAYSLLHEYVHYLINDHMHYNHKANEAVTEYVSVYVLENRLQRASYKGDPHLRMLYRKTGLWDEENDTLDIRMASEFEAFDYAHSAPGIGPYLAIDGYEILRPRKVTIWDLSYAEGASFVNWLVEVYGWETVMDNIHSTDALFELWDNQDFSEVHGQWIEHIDRVVADFQEATNN